MHLLNHAQFRPAPAKFAPAPSAAFLNATGKNFIAPAGGSKTGLLPGTRSAVQATLAREGNFAIDKTKYKHAYLVFYEAAIRTFPTFRELEWDPKTTLVFTTSEEMARNAETHLLIRNSSGWMDIHERTPSQWMTSGVSQREMRIEMVLNPNFKEISQILQTLSHEWAVHGESEWQFIRWMRQQPSTTEDQVEDILNEWATRNGLSYAGEFPLNADVQHGDLAVGSNQSLVSFSQRIATFLPEGKRARFMEIWREDVLDHQSVRQYGRVPQPVVSTTTTTTAGSSDALSSFVAPSNQKELDDFYS